MGLTLTDEMVGNFQPPTTEAEDLAEAVNGTLERLDEDSARTYILVELRGTTVEEAATITGQLPWDVKLRVEGVNGLLRSVLARRL